MTSVYKTMSKDQHLSNFIPQNGPFQGRSIPESIITEFIDVCFSSKETLALLIGYKEGNEIIPTELVFPKQKKKWYKKK